MKRDLDLLSLIAGLVFVAAGIGHLLGLTVASAGVLRAWPALLVIAGVAIIARRRRTTDE